MVLLAWPVALHAIRADKKGMAALIPASCMIKIYMSMGKEACRSPFLSHLHSSCRRLSNSASPREINGAGAWAVHCPVAVPVCYWFACYLALFCPILRQWSALKQKKLAEAAMFWVMSETFLALCRRKQPVAVPLIFACCVQKHVQSDKPLQTRISQEKPAEIGKRAFWSVPSVISWEVPAHL